MKIVADENIPLLAHLVGAMGELLTLPGSEIRPETLKDADALIVRSVTRVNESLLSGTSVRFVGTATAGTDHVDKDYLAAHDVTFSYAPGSNADSVVDYVIAALYALAAECDCELENRRLGVVGVGAVGSRLVRRARGLGMNVLCCDPPREDAGLTDDDVTTRADFVPLSQLLEASEIISLHVPLTLIGPHPTVQMIGDAELARLSSTAWILNTSRGTVVDEPALLAALRRNPDLRCVLDVWSGEPTPNEEILRRVHFGTPHIAGYAYDGKVAGARTIAHALRAFTGAAAPPEGPQNELPRKRLVHAGSTRSTSRSVLKPVVDQLYDFAADVEAFRAVGAAELHNRADVFRALRRDYPQRREFSAWDVSVASTSEPAFRELLERGLGVRVVTDHGS